MSTVDYTAMAWRKSSHSGGGSDNACVEVAFADDTVGVRDSKDRTGTPLVFPAAAWRMFRRAPEAG